jgi:SPX domain protein involved in polyphosphate accumulation
MQNRYERKFYILNRDKNFLENMVKRLNYGFREIFWTRSVNNIYWDTLNYDYYKNSVDGIAIRKKVRLRWYNDFEQMKNPIMEIKKKKGHIGSKIRYTGEYAELFEKLKKQSLQPTLANSYRRSYFKSFDQKIRITIDSDLEFWPVSNLEIDVDKKKDLEGLILEIKYQVSDALAASQVTNEIPFRVKSFSKYCRGLECLNQVHFYNSTF